MYVRVYVRKLWREAKKQKKKQLKQPTGRNYSHNKKDFLTIIINKFSFVSNTPKVCPEISGDKHEKRKKKEAYESGLCKKIC